MIEMMTMTGAVEKAKTFKEQVREETTWEQYQAVLEDVLSFYTPGLTMSDQLHLQQDAIFPLGGLALNHPNFFEGAKDIFKKKEAELIKEDELEMAGVLGSWARMLEAKPKELVGSKLDKQQLV